MPALDISGYGETLEKAEEILKYTLQEFFIHLLKLTPSKLQIELAKLGWRRGIFNKEYSKTYVDINGELKNLNAENDQVERIALTTA